MKIISNFTFAGVLVALAAICFPLGSQAQLATTIHLFQNSDSLNIQAEIQGSVEQKNVWVLSRQAEIQSSSGFEVSEDAELNHVLKRTDGSTAQVKYSLKIDQSQPQFLTEEENWYPRLDDLKVEQTFSVQSQTEVGVEVIHSATGKLQTGVAIVVGKFTKYVSPSGKILVYLQNQDPDLAKTLIANLENYLTADENNLSPYPYDHFSVVESSDEVGLAFPRMTWIGSQLLRFPFILKTSLPHELLHSWWGNSVFVDYEKGNWCEGLTVFGADYALLNDSEKTTYRQKALLEYVDYVKQTEEISLAEFVSRGEDRALQAIGYNKSLMMFVMLEQLVGVENLKQELAKFNSMYQFKVASYENLFEILKDQVGAKTSSLDVFYKNWILKKGAIEFNKIEGKSIQQEQGYRITFKLDSKDIEKIGDVPVEFLIVFKDGSSTVVKSLVTDSIQFNFSKEPSEFVIDPQFKLFRKLSDIERPVTFSKFFGSAEAEIISSPENLQTVQQVFPTIQFKKTDLNLVDLNSEGTILIENYQGGVSQIDLALAKKSVAIKNDSVQIDSDNISLSENGYFISVRVQSKIVILFRTNSSLPAKRWFERWSRYGGQGFVILTPTAAAKQGLWNNPLIRQFN